MKAKDTVMAVTDREIVDVINNPRRSLEDQLVMQAEISFKAGIKEVVESPIYLAAMGGETTIRRLFELHPEGEAKLKEWEL